MGYVMQADMGPINTTLLTLMTCEQGMTDSEFMKEVTDLQEHLYICEQCPLPPGRENREISSVAIGTLRSLVDDKDSNKDIRILIGQNRKPSFTVNEDSIVMEASAKELVKMSAALTARIFGPAGSMLSLACTIAPSDESLNKLFTDMGTKMAGKIPGFDNFPQIIRLSCFCMRPTWTDDTTISITVKNDKAANKASAQQLMQKHGLTPPGLNELPDFLKGFKPRG